MSLFHLSEIRCPPRRALDDVGPNRFERGAQGEHGAVVAGAARDLETQGQVARAEAALTVSAGMPVKL
ncbi:MAG: hypothetical protein R2851_24550 [Caldilineaceae bacterium]